MKGIKEIKEIRKNLRRKIRPSYTELRSASLFVSLASPLSLCANMSVSCLGHQRNPLTPKGMASSLHVRLGTPLCCALLGGKFS